MSADRRTCTVQVRCRLSMRQEQQSISRDSLHAQQFAAADHSGLRSLACAVHLDRLVDVVIHNVTNTVLYVHQEREVPIHHFALPRTSHFPEQNSYTTAGMISGACHVLRLGDASTASKNAYIHSIYIPTTLNLLRAS